LRKLDPATHAVSTVAALLDQPLAVAPLSADVLLVAEGDGNRIDAIHLPDGKVTPWPIAGLHAPAAHTCKR
jgi:hypothetical protein